MQPTIGPFRSLHRHPTRVAAFAALLLAAAPHRAAAYGSYGSKIETGSAISLFAVGGLLAVPTAFVLVDDPLTTQRVVGRSLVIAGGLVMIGFGAYYFISDDPLWIPHALGWGIGGSLAISGFVCWVVDEDPGEDAAEAGEGVPGRPEAATGETPAPATPDLPPGETGGTPAARRSSPPAAGRFGLAPWLAPGGAGILLAAAW
ncbi:MAG: hypothetical protein GYA57_16745 [Myxococcales bacterium]|nr:hypothetical protein [Myxococcales bacterium]